MHKVITQYAATGIKGKRGYVLQWVGPSKPSYIVGPLSTHAWYKNKAAAVARAVELNAALSYAAQAKAHAAKMRAATEALGDLGKLTFN